MKKTTKYVPSAKVKKEVDEEDNRFREYIEKQDEIGDEQNESN